jgi:hypothetical protein
MNRGVRRNRKPSGGIELGALEPRVLWSATPHPLVRKPFPPMHHAKPVVVAHRATKVTVVPAPKPTLAAPSALVTAVQNGSVQLHWTDHARAALGYRVLRSTEGGAFSLINNLPSGRAVTFCDRSVAAGQSYTYEVQAYAGNKISAYSGAASAALPPLAPSAPAGLSASLAGPSSVDLAWSAQGGSASGFLVLRSVDGIHFSPIAQAAGSTAAEVDASVVAGEMYWYRVEAFNGGGVSPASNTASASVPPIVPPNTISIATRFNSELVVTASGTGDSIALAQVGGTLTITADGWLYSEPVPAAGVFVYARGGGDAISIASSVSVRTTVETIDGATSRIASAGTNVSAWIDSIDSFSGAGAVHRVGSFAGGVSKAQGASLPDPSDAGNTTTVDLSLWGTGPVVADVNQGEVGDCYFLASLAAFAGAKPSVLTESAVDMGDGTYVVQFQSGGTEPTYVRVNADMPIGPFGGFLYAHPGANDTLWAMVLEKAFTYFRSGDNSYNSISGGWMQEVYCDLGVSSSDFTPGSHAESAFYSMACSDLAQGQAVTLATSDSPPDLVADHAYTLVSAWIDSSGVTHYLVRNPWGVSGDALENAQGCATLTFAQIVANFTAGTQAVA